MSEAIPPPSIPHDRIPSPPFPSAPPIPHQTTPLALPISRETETRIYKRKRVESTSRGPRVSIDDEERNHDMEQPLQFDSANFPTHFDTWDQFHTEVDVDVNDLSDEE
ncbi:hypothetical protein M0R45_030830 [Rubus argutus]|uniref:Uncharacterized protein n=1 Tax=Rubus argutus TaxID=59490 RepID=A0AAW1WFE6_RUBAR